MFPNLLLSWCWWCSTVKEEGRRGVVISFCALTTKYVRNKSTHEWWTWRSNQKLMCLHNHEATATPSTHAHFPFGAQKRKSWSSSSYEASPHLKLIFLQYVQSLYILRNYAYTVDCGSFKVGVRRTDSRMWQAQFYNKIALSVRTKLRSEDSPHPHNVCK